MSNNHFRPKSNYQRRKKAKWRKRGEKRRKKEKNEKKGKCKKRGRRCPTTTYNYQRPLHSGNVFILPPSSSFPKYLQFLLYFLSQTARSCLVRVHLLNDREMTRLVVCSQIKRATSLDQPISQLFPQPVSLSLSGSVSAFVCSCFCSQVKGISR